MQSKVFILILSLIAISRVVVTLTTPCIQNGKLLDIRPFGTPGETPLFIRHLRCKNSELEKVGHLNFYKYFEQLESGGALLAMVTGDKSKLSPEKWEIWRKSGVGHILVISGQHLAILVFIFFMIFTQLQRIFPFFFAKYNLNKWNGIILIPLIWSYIFWTGAGGATIRAGMMLSVFLVYKALYLRFTIIQWFLLSTLIIIIISPTTLTEPGFHLSLFAVFGIIFAYKNFQPKNMILRWYIVTLGAIIGVLPVAAYYFGEFALFGWLSSLLASPVVAFILPITAFATVMLLLNISSVAKIFLTVSNLTLTLFEKLVLIPVSKHKLALFAVPINGITELVILIIATVAVYKLIKSRKYYLSIVSVLFSLILIDSIPNLVWFLTKAPKTLEWTTLSVGQGESLLFRFPTGESMLVDAGGFFDNKFDPGESLVVPALNSVGVSTVDLLISSHPDIDHIKGLFAVIKRKRVKKIWINHEILNPIQRRFLDEAKKRNIPIEFNPRGKIYFGKVKVEVLNGHSKYGSTNNNSIVLKISYKKVSFLVTGDIEKDREESLLKSKQSIDVDVLKIAHHGSKTSSIKEFINATSPNVAIISSGYNNRYHHPHFTVIDRFKKRKLPYFVTSSNGSIKVETDGVVIETKCYGPYRRKWAKCD